MDYTLFQPHDGRQRYTTSCLKKERWQIERPINVEVAFGLCADSNLIE